jgi:GR25 family glycosyltransferase involved in LPS biosynthesis
MSDNSKTNKVENCIIINLERRPDLWEGLSEFRQKMKASGIDVVRLEGRDTSKETNVIQNLYTEGILDLDSIGWRKNVKQFIGELGCFVSHYNALKMVIDKGLDKCLILEDGIQFLRTDFENLEIRPGIDIVICHPHMSQKSKLDGWGLQGYIVSQSGAKKILKHAFPLACPYDLALRELMRRFTLAYYEQEKPFFMRKYDRESSVGLPEGHTDNDVVEKQNMTKVWKRIIDGCISQGLNIDNLIN